MRVVRVLPLCALALSSTIAAAHHRQTPPIARFTTAGENDLPRLPSYNGVFALSVDGQAERRVVRFTFPYPTTTSLVATQGQAGNPVVSLDGGVIAWDANAFPGGRQIIVKRGENSDQITTDPSGTSVNPAVNGTGSRIAFESKGDLVGTGTAGIQQVYLWERAGRSIRRISSGAGVGSNPALSRSGLLVAFESTSDPSTGLDTGVSQIWLYFVKSGASIRLTSGVGSSRLPTFSADGRILVFESTADLANGGEDTGISQIFAYDTRTGTYAQITTPLTDPGGCSSPSVHKFRRDWRVPFLCSGNVYFYLLRGDARYLVPLPAGETTRVLAQPGFQFLMISTTASLLGGPPTPNHQIYLVNLYKQPPLPAPGASIWFPWRGIPNGK